MKRCTGCKLVKANAQFSKKASSKDGFNTRCRACSHLQYLEWKARKAAQVAVQSAPRMGILRRFMDWVRA